MKVEKKLVSKVMGVNHFKNNEKEGRVIALP
jgi:hypothetical protein